MSDLSRRHSAIRICMRASSSSVASPPADPAPLALDSEASAALLPPTVAASAGERAPPTASATSDSAPPAPPSALNLASASSRCRRLMASSRSRCRRRYAARRSISALSMSAAPSSSAAPLSLAPSPPLPPLPPPPSATGLDSRSRLAANVAVAAARDASASRASAGRGCCRRGSNTGGSDDMTGLGAASELAVPLEGTGAAGRGGAVALAEALADGLAVISRSSRSVVLPFPRSGATRLVPPALWPSACSSSSSASRRRVL
mmetsp:Transcript_12853/g.41050  ORF Transcript_12853/g.41050 Transcript_12853/m.41050 type:complete len:262 (+) Transcript_12853:274-1059(+)